MHPPTANGIDPRLSFWLRVREFAVPPSMIESATDRRLAGDWRGACAAAGFDVDIDLSVSARTYGADIAAQVSDDLHHLAPDLLRWHLPRVAPDGLLRPALTVTLAGYGDIVPGNRCRGTGSVYLVVRTAPAWADAGQRVVLTCGTARIPGTIRTRVPMHDFGSTSTGTCGTRAGPENCDYVVAQDNRRTERRSTPPWPR